MKLSICHTHLGGLVSVFQEVPVSPPDVIFNLTAMFKADTAPEKINVGVGAFRTDELKPYVLPVVKKVIKKKRKVLGYSYYIG
jgi:aspartate aminotransferase